MEKIKVAFIGSDKAFEAFEKSYVASVTTVTYIHLNPEGRPDEVLGHEFNGLHVDRSAFYSEHTLNLINRVKSRIR